MSPKAKALREARELAAFLRRQHQKFQQRRRTIKGCWAERRLA